MPEMDGYDLTRAIRREEAGRALARMPIIACTANALPGEADVCIAAGMDDYLAKPVEMMALARALDKWLPLPAAGGPPSAPAGVEAGPAPIEPGPLAELTGGDQAMERDILLEYKTANDQDVAALSEALARKDLPGVVRAAHRIKGASRMVGAGALAAVCASIEQAGRQEDWPAVTAEESRLRREVERLDAYLTSRGGRALMEISEIRFLIAEDHEFQRKTLVRMLTSLGAREVREAGDGRAALEAFRDPARPVDIIICDLDMPEMDGMEFIRHVGETGAQVSVILSSALDRT